MKIEVSHNSLAFRVYQQQVVSEPFSCNYELNPDFRGELELAGLRVSGVSEDGGARIIELPDHLFFLGTGFVPQFTSKEGEPHPLIVAFFRAAMGLGDAI